MNQLTCFFHYCVLFLFRSCCLLMVEKLLPEAPPGSPHAPPPPSDLQFNTFVLLPYGFPHAHPHAPLPPPTPTPPRTPPHISYLISQSCSSPGPLNQVLPPPLGSSFLHHCCNRTPPTTPPPTHTHARSLPPASFAGAAVRLPRSAADPILPPSAIDVPLSERRGSGVMQTRGLLARWLLPFE